MTNLIRNYDVTVNILQGKISQTQDGSYGTLFIHLDGEEQVITDAIRFYSITASWSGGDYTCLAVGFQM